MWVVLLGDGRGFSDFHATGERVALLADSESVGREESDERVGRREQWEGVITK